MPNKIQHSTKQQQIALCIILAIGAALRLAYVLSVDSAPSGGDALWYLSNGIGIWNGDTVGVALGNKTYNTALIPTAPLFLIVSGFWQHLLGFEGGVLVMRLLHVVLNVFSIYLAYDITTRLARNPTAGLVAATVLSFSPVLIFEPVQIGTETMYVTFIVLGIAAYLWAIEPSANRPTLWLFVCATALGLATLTRAVSILFPLGLAGHWLLTHGRHDWRKGLMGMIALLVVYSAVVSTWTWHNWVNNQRFVVASSELMAALWRGAVPESGSPYENDALLGDDTHSEQIAEIIQTDAVAYGRNRIVQLVEAHMQPHGVLELGGESLRYLALDWMRSDFDRGYFLRLVRADTFLPKLSIYIWHYLSLAFGLVGMWICRARWRMGWPLLGFVLYTTLVHLALFAIPRYIFPNHIFYWCFGAVALTHLWTRQRQAAH